MLRPLSLPYLEAEIADLTLRCAELMGEVETGATVSNYPIDGHGGNRVDTEFLGVLGDLDRLTWRKRGEYPVNNAFVRVVAFDRRRIDNRLIPG